MDLTQSSLPVKVTPVLWGPGKLAKIFLLVVNLWQHAFQAIDFQFSQPVKSNQKSLREIYAGPLPGFFAQCLSATECAVY